VTTSQQQTTTTTTATTTAPAAPAAPTTATVPDVAGQTEQAAVTSFSKAGVLPSLVWVPNQAPLGSVVQQAKSSGTTVPYHAHVQVNLSRGPGDKADVTVPDVAGKTLTDAVATINAAHLRVLYVRFPLTSKSQAGTIVQQSPLAGGKAPENAQVLVFLGAYRP
jgi:serine/threonine-protein kinase